jgi:hypothetical protein
MPEEASFNIYFPPYSAEQAGLCSELEQVLLRAGISIVRGNAFQEATCSVHVLFPQYGIPAEGDASISEAKRQYLLARKQLEQNPHFRMFIWLPPSTDLAQTEPRQLEFINEVKNTISQNMVFNNSPSALLFADDIRNAMERSETLNLNLNSTDIFFISNELDEDESNEIIDMLTDIVPVERLRIVQDSETDYSELCKQQIAKSKLAVVYFKSSADWALPFAQQVWKKIGGASSHTPILLIGDEDPDTNMNKKFKAPKVISLIIAGELIPLEIKVNFDKVLEGKV